MSNEEWVSHLPGAEANLAGLLAWQAEFNGERPAYTFRADDESERTLSYAQLARRAWAIAATLQRTAKPGDRVLLVFPAGLDFIAAFYGCVAAGMLAVPATYPKPKRPMSRLSAIAVDCEATVALTTAQTLATLDAARTAPELARLKWIATDSIADDEASSWNAPRSSPDDLVFLQYTSGSTSVPKGVMISQANLFANLAMIRQGFQLPALTDGPEGPGNAVFWLPAYHDMGLIGGILTAIYTGAHSVLMSPTTFLQWPVRWLKAISDYRAVVSGGPNFGYELCLRKITAEQRETLDLSHWRVAFCGAEPIRADTLELFAETFEPCGFRAEAFYPCYGLAEATLLGAGGDGPAAPAIRSFDRRALADHRVVQAEGDQEIEHAQDLVGCGHGLLGEEVAIVDPATLRRAAAQQVGEIWLRGPNVARGYWNRESENDEVFGGRMAETGEGPFLRTGDLGFVSQGQLFVTGRLKDVIIIRGRNHYPQDIELTAQMAHPALDASSGAAFGMGENGAERLVLVHEIDRQHRRADFKEVIRAIRRAVTAEHEIELHAVTLIRQASLPRTTSGKVQRALCGDRFLAGTLKVVAEWRRGEPRSVATPVAGGNGHSAHGGNGGPAAPHRPARPSMSPRATDRELQGAAEQIEAFILAMLQQRGGVPADELDRQRPFADYALDSYTAVEISQELADWLDVKLAPVVAWNYPTPAALAEYLARRLAGLETEAVEASPVAADAGPDDNVARLLAEIEGLSEEEVEAALQLESPNH
jgi:acyl-CoA synthetase (AMP-forming)/AMP-acid ligase II/acyl carrier protein